MRVLTSVLICVSLLNNNIGADDCDATNRPKSVEARLRKTIFCNYDNSVRPVLNIENATQVTIQMRVKFIDYQDKTDVIRVSSWITMIWKDQHLTWNITDYDNIVDIDVSSEMLWIPDLSLYNSDISAGTSSAFVTQCKLYSSGEVLCVPAVTHSAKCHGDVTRWPYDTQNCTLRFGSWVHTGEQVDFKDNSVDAFVIDMDEYTANRQWALKTVNVTKHHGKYNCCPNETFPSLRYSFIMERHASTYAVTLLAPGLVMVILTLVSMWLEPGCPERLFLLSINLLCQFIFIQQLFYYVPINGDKCPLVLLFFRDSMIITALTVLITVVVRCMSGSSVSPPSWILAFSNFMLNSRPGQLLLLNELNLKSAASEMDAGEDDGAILVGVGMSVRPNEWRLLAILLDRISFFVFFIAYVGMLLAMFPK